MKKHTAKIHSACAGLFLAFAAFLYSCGGKGADAPAETSKIKYVTPKIGLNLRSQPDLKGRRIMTLPRGARVTVVLEKDAQNVQGVTGRWVLVKYEEKQGWVFDAYLSANKPMPDQEASQEVKPKPTPQNDGIPWELREKPSPIKKPFTLVGVHFEGGLECSQQTYSEYAVNLTFTDAKNAVRNSESGDESNVFYRTTTGHYRIIGTRVMVTFFREKTKLVPYSKPDSDGEVREKKINEKYEFIMVECENKRALKQIDPASSVQYSFVYASNSRLEDK